MKTSLPFFTFSWHLQKGTVLFRVCPLPYTMSNTSWKMKNLHETKSKFSHHCATPKKKHHTFSTWPSSPPLCTGCPKWYSSPCYASSAISKWKCCFSYRRHHDAQEAKQWPRCARQQWPDGSIWSQPAGMAQGDDFKMKRISRIACPGGELERETRCAWIERSRHLNAARWNGARCWFRNEKDQIACPGGERKQEMWWAWSARSRHLSAARWNGVRC